MRKRYKILIAGAAVLVAALAVIFFCFSSFLVIEDTETGEIIARYKLGDKTGFAVSFIHSVNKSLVKESYSIDGGDIYLETCLYSAFGAGVATEVNPPQTLEFLDDGSMLISGFHRKIGRLAYFVGTVSNMKLHIGSEEVDLKDLCGEKRNIEFKVEKQFVF